MTFVFETYKDDAGNIAYIQQEKYSALFEVEVFAPSSCNVLGYPEYRKTFTSKENAKRAIKRNYPTMKRSDD